MADESKKPWTVCINHNSCTHLEKKLWVHVQLVLHVLYYYHTIGHLRDPPTDWLTVTIYPYWIVSFLFWFYRSIKLAITNSYISNKREHLKERKKLQELWLVVDVIRTTQLDTLIIPYRTTCTCIYTPIAYYTILYCTIIIHTITYHTILYHTMPHYIMLYCTCIYSTHT